MTKSRESGSDKIITGASCLQKRAEQDKHENHTGGNSQGNTIYTLGCQPVVSHPFGETGPFMGNNFGHIWTRKSVQGKYHGHNHQRRAKCTPGCFQQQDKPNKRYAKIKHCRLSRTGREIRIK